VDPRAIARLLVAGRLAAGASLVVFPDRAATLALRSPRRRRAARQVLRATGVRDLALASGLLAALSGRGSVRRWAVAGAAADAVDLLAVLALRRELEPHAFAGTVAAASGGVLQGLAAARAPD
jgi:type IV secretory pathway TrbD component